MKAMLFAAGLGTRLKPLTDHKPKALVEADGTPLLGHALALLESHGCTSVVVNVHHFADQIEDYLAAYKTDMHIAISDERDHLLETGGGLLHARPYLDGDEPFLVYNTDIVTDLDLGAFYRHHLDRDALATLAVRQRDTSRYFLYDDAMVLHGWAHLGERRFKVRRLPETELRAWAFSGIHVVSPRLFDLFEERGKFSITDTYLRLCATERILGYPHDESAWYDAGKPETLAAASEYLHFKSRPPR